MKNKEFRILKYLLNYGTGYVSLGVIATKTRLTFRQVLSIVNSTKSDCFKYVRDTDEKESYVYITADEDKCFEEYKRVVQDYYNISGSDECIVFDSLSKTEWRSTSDIIEMSGLNKSKVVQILSVLFKDNVVDTNNDRGHVYRLK